MLIKGKPCQSIWFDTEAQKVCAIDQRKLPFGFETFEIATLRDCFLAIKDMVVRGAPLIGVTAAYGMYVAIKNDFDKLSVGLIEEWAVYLKSSRPTAVNLKIIVDDVSEKLKMHIDKADIVDYALHLAKTAEQGEIDNCGAIGDYGLPIIEKAYRANDNKTVNILTHCNAGWLACVDWGTALAPVYKAREKGIPVHVWVDETRPRNQGARLTAWELDRAEVAYTIIADNTGGHLMQHSIIDLVIVGSDRTTLNGDVANKIGTYLKALAARDNNVPFYVALPSTSIDFYITDGIANIPIEERDGNELKTMDCLVGGQPVVAQLIPDGFNVANYGFDVTPARLVTALITERGVCNADTAGILNLFPEHS